MPKNIRWTFSVGDTTLQFTIGVEPRQLESVALSILLSVGYSDWMSQSVIAVGYVLGQPGRTPHPPETGMQITLQFHFTLREQYRHRSHVLHFALVSSASDIYIW